MTAGRPKEAIEIADRAIALAERFNDPFALANALISKGGAMIGGGESAADAVALIDRGRSVALEAGLVTTAARGWNNQSLFLGFLGWSLERQLAFVREGIAYARSHGQERSMVAWLHRGEAELLAQSGDLEGAVRTWDAVRQRSDYLGGVGPLMWLLALDGPAAARPAALEVELRQGGDPQQFVPRVGLTALVLMFNGEIDEARRRAQTLLERCDEEGVAAMVGGPWHTLIAPVAVATGVYGLLEVIRSWHRAPSPEAGQMRLAALAAADALRSGDLATAGRSLARHAEIAETLGFPFTAAQFVVNTAIVAGMETVAGVPEWVAPLRSARAFATKAKARWWLGQLPTLPV